MLFGTKNGKETRSDAAGIVPNPSSGRQIPWYVLQELPGIKVHSCDRPGRGELPGMQ
ncbi:Hypothetical protein FKW44_002682 [Caligus rogercresseyi]|uniref:Uncharacterized protein n=1 Tax=Caligus rogercresseyi TaxID=217165 RepID=A0A7T8KKI4_CALRO|nr:Hypothetical protein FKW44_002682 [Caligus rogercresseyi]